MLFTIKKITKQPTKAHISGMKEKKTNKKPATQHLLALS